ncbi:MAG: class I SAM-dependent methyltransferase [Pyrinomonadaceae bacterium]
MNELMDTQLDPQQQTLASFDWQWAHLPEGDFMPGDPWFDAHATRILAEELCALRPDWFAGKRVLDAGCGQGRWTRSLLELGAVVTAIDYSEAGLKRTRQICGATERLTTRRVNLLELPDDLRQQSFDLVFSFGVLHHTGDTWGALHNVAPLVGEGGALFLYLYGAQSWTTQRQKGIEELRQTLAPLSFDQKIARLRSHFPGEDPHQLFDLMSPVINDRVLFSEVAAKLSSMQFQSVEQTVASTEIYLRAIRAGFPPDALLPCIDENSTLISELARRDAVRNGAAFEDRIREKLKTVPLRQPLAAVLHELSSWEGGREILDASLPPDCLPADAVPGYQVRKLESPSLITPQLENESDADVVLLSGASLGACRHPEAMLAALWSRVRPDGLLIVEVAEKGFAEARRSLADKLVDYREDVAGKLARLLSRRKNWCSGEALFALGGDSLLNPIAVGKAEAILKDGGATSIEVRNARPGTLLLTARKSKR